MTKLSYKVSYYALYVMMALILVVLGLFFGVGYTNPVGDYNAPEHTETLIYFMYAMFGVCVLVTVLGALVQFFALLRDNPKGAMKSLFVLALFLIVLGVSYAIASDATLVMADGTEYTDVTWLKTTDMIIYSIYILLAVAAAATLVNLSGLLKK